MIEYKFCVNNKVSLLKSSLQLLNLPETPIDLVLREDRIVQTLEIVSLNERGMFN